MTEWKDTGIDHESKPMLLRRVAKMQVQVARLEADLAKVRQDYERLLRGEQPLVEDPNADEYGR